MNSLCDIVKLDIGGSIFKTTKRTLTKFDGFFKTMLESDIPIKKDEFGCIFIDRSPNHFGLILNFMRDGDVILPKSTRKLYEIQKEAQYYLLEGLIEHCNNKLQMKDDHKHVVPKKLRISGDYHFSPVNLTFPCLSNVPVPDENPLRDILDQESEN